MQDNKQIDLQVKEKPPIHNQKQQDEIEKHSQQMWLTDKFVQQTNKMVLVTAGVFVLAAALVFLLGLFELDATEGREYLIWSDEKVETLDCWTQMQDDFQDYQDKLITIPERSQIEHDYTSHIILECESCDNVLSASSLKKLYEIEQAIFKLPEYKDYCLATAVSKDCAADAYLSLTQEFSDPSTVTEEDFQALITKIQTNEDYFTKYKTLFARDFTSENSKSLHIRSIFKFGTPLLIDGKLKAGPGEDQDDFDDAQLEKFEDFSQIFMDTSRAIPEPSGIRVIEYSKIINDLETGNIVMEDFMLVIGSVLFVFTYMSFHLKSTFLAGMAMINIIISFPITLLIFSAFQITYFSSLHIMAIFIVLGIAADDVFVFIDAWDQSAGLHQLTGNYERRMAYTFRRAANAMLATSSTTAACFFATGMSEIMPLASFGIFAGILVPINFLLVITAFPIFIMFYERKFKEFQWPCVKFISEKLQKRQQQEGVQKKKEEHESKIEQFFENVWSPFTYKARFIILGCFAAWIGIAAWQSTKLEPVKEEEEFLPDSLETIYAADLVKNHFHISHIDMSSTLTVYYFLGTKDINRDGVSKWDYETNGKVEYDEEFDLSPKENQQWLYDFCTNIKTNEMVLDEQVICFMPSFKAYVESKSLTFPLEKDQFRPELDEFVKTPEGQYYFHRKDIGIIDEKLKYFQIQITAKGKPTGGYDYLNPLYEKWEQFRAEQEAAAPSGMKWHKQTALTPWVYMPTEKAFVSNAVEGILISIGFSFIVLLLTSHNVITSLFSMLSIVGVICSVITVIVLAGWELGISESIALVIVIGLSVDYVVHLANHYVESVAQETRFDKVQHSLKEIGVSIVSGAITTVGSGIFLLFATSLLFNKFGILIISTIIFAVLFSLGFFIALLQVFGPVGNAGNIAVVFNKVMPAKCKKQSNENAPAPAATATNDIENQKKQQNQEQKQEQVQIS